MLEAARKASSYVQGQTWASFSEDSARQDAVAYQIQVIGEAATSVSQEFRDAHPEVPWAIIIGMRHKIVHNYRDLRRDILWSTAQDDLPDLIRLLEPLIPPLPEEP